MEASFCRRLRAPFLLVSLLLPLWLTSTAPASEPVVAPVALAPGSAVSPGRDVQMEAAMDSAAALENLAGGVADLALVQEDRLRDWLARQPMEGPSRSLGVVTRLYARPLYVLVREPLHLEGVEDLARLRLVLGPDPDGRAALRALLDRVGLPARSTDPVPCGEDVSGVDFPARLAACFRQGALDAALLLGTPGTDLFSDLLESGEARLESLDYRTLRLLRLPTGSEGPYFAVTLDRWGGTLEDGEVRTLAVPVLLVARSGVPRVEARRTAEALREAVRARSAPQAVLLPSDSLESSRLPLAEEWFDGPEVRRDGLWTFLSILPLAVVLALFLVFLVRSRSRTLRRLRQSLPLAVTLFLVPSAIVLVTLATYLAEHRYNEHFSSPTESFWSITVYLFSGLEDRTPYTPAGKAAAAFGLLLGPVLFTIATGWVASRFIHWERKMPKNLQGHYLMLNWNPRGLQAVRQIHHPVIVDAEGTGVIVVLTDDPDVQRQLERDGMGSDPFFEDLFISLGDPTHERALLNANAQDTRSILVLADERLGEHADERTLRALFMLRKIARDHGRDDLHVVAEIVNPANQVVGDQMADDFPGLLECIGRGEIRSCLLAQATLNGGVVQFYKDLLTVSEETNELYVLPLPEEAVGLTFREYAVRVLSEGSGRPVVPVGIQRSDGRHQRMYCNPRRVEGGDVLRSGDRLVVLAYQPPRAEELPRPARRESA